ncbi:MAG: prepilin peptidase [Ruminococcus sp.]|nr:prepilin peptidase [Ruminococcus sp.]
MLYLAYFIIYAFIFIFGAIIGSFLNVCIYRLPTGESIVTGGSHCMTCKEKIKKYDLIPIVSYIILKGKCRSCGAKISPRYALVEALTGVLYVLTFMYFGIDSCVEAVIVCMLLSCLIIVFFMDLDTRLINMPVVGAIGLLAVVKLVLTLTDAAEFSNPLSLKYTLFGAFVISVPFLLIFLFSKGKALGFGDVMLVLAGGAYLGLKAAIIAAFIGLITGSVAGLISKHRSGDSMFAFGPWLSLGIAVAAFFGDYLADLYLIVSGLK